MNFNELKFSFDIECVNKMQLDCMFRIICDNLNYRFDEDFNLYHADSDVIYQYDDVSNQTSAEIKQNINSFFSFTFDDIIDTPLYKFSVLKNNDKLTILAIINSLIFNYDSIKNFQNLFDDLGEESFENDISKYFDDANDYLNSPDFKRDWNYWQENILDVGDYVRFYNLKSNNYESITIPIENLRLLNILKEWNVSKFDFITAIFALYLSRIDRSGGCLLKTVIPGGGRLF